MLVVNVLVVVLVVLPTAVFYLRAAPGKYRTPVASIEGRGAISKRKVSVGEHNETGRA
jgi:hypothetical protein